MKKPPAFQFYPDDYLSDSSIELMSLEQQGAYWRLCCFAWKSTPVGHLLNDRSTLAGLSRLGDRWDDNAEAILRAFRVSDDGKTLYQKRLVEEFNRLEERRNQAVEAGKASAKARSTTVERPLNDRSPEAPTKVNPSSASSVASSSAEDLKHSRASAHVDETEEGEEIFGERVFDGMALAALWWTVLVRDPGDPGYIVKAALLIRTYASAQSEPKDPFDLSRELLKAFAGLLAEWRTKGKGCEPNALKFVEHFGKICDWYENKRPAKITASPYSNDAPAPSGRVVPSVQETDELARARAAIVPVGPPAAFLDLKSKIGRDL